MLRITVAAFVLLAGALPWERAAAAGCYEDWSIAAPIVREQGLATVETLARRAEKKISGDIVKTTLCEEKGGFVYRLLIRDPNGRLTNHTVDARTPFAP
jgi:uncharacterized membrane protein YkoI